MRGEAFISGRWRRGSGQGFASLNPADGAEVWRGAAVTPDEVAQAFAGAAEAWPSWAQTPLPERVAIARRFAERVQADADGLARLICQETGKTLWDAKGEVAAVANKIEISIQAQAERAGQRTADAPFGAIRLSHRPLGVMAVFGPFNFPAHLPNGHIAPALLAGDALVFKPSELTPGVGERLVELWVEAGVPPGVLSLVQGGADIGAAMLAAPQLAGVLFTGSATVGAHIHRAFAGRPDIVLALEMGGNNPLIAWPPAEAAAAANIIAHSAFVSAGQRCSCARRLVVPDNDWGRAVIEELTEICSRLEPKPYQSEPEGFLGPMVREGAADKAERAALQLLTLGGRALTPILRTGAFFRPAMLDMTGADEPPDEEIFAPLLQVWRVKDVDAALVRANATRFGLAGGVICDDEAVAESLMNGLRAGVLAWNRPTTGASSALPFGGFGVSGSARPSAYYAADYCAHPVAEQRAPVAKAIPAPGLSGG